MKIKNYIRDLSVRGKILLIIGINIFFLLVVGVITFIGLEKLDVIKNQITINGDAATTQGTADMMHDALRADVYKALLTDSGDVDGYKEVQADLDEHVKIFNENISKLSALDVDSSIKSQAVQVKAPLEAYINTSSDIVKSVVENTVDYKSESGKKVLEDYKKVFDNLAVEMEALSEKIDEVSNQMKEEGSLYAADIKKSLVILISAVILLALVVSLYIVKIIVSPVVTSESILAKLSAGEMTDTVPVEGKDETARMLNSLNGVVTNLSNVKQFVTEVGNGNFETEITVFNNQGDIYESLNKMKNDLKHTAEEDKKRNWATEGMAKFGDILRANNEGLDKLADNIISNMVKYLGANQGGLFLVNDNDPNDKHLNLIACYAWNKKKYINMRVDMGEGLVGQAWQENDMLYITEVPENFVRITSGLGDANPKSFLIVPLTMNDETYGVIEIASFGDFADYQKEFVKKLAESIASTLATAKTNERTKQLLEQSQQQTEEMRAQEEEMRQNMEEMQATQEEMERKEMEMQKMLEQMRQQEEEMKQNMEEMAATQEEMTKQNAIIAEAKAETDSVLHGINATMATIEFTPEGNVITANENFTKTMKCTVDEIRGKHHSNFVPKEIKEGDDYRTLWSRLASGVDIKGEFKRINAKGEVVWLNAIYNPIKNADGKVVKVIKFAIDITEQKEAAVDLSARMMGINSTMATIEFTPEGKVLDANDNFLNTMKCTLADIKGKHHKNFVPKSILESEEYKTFWSDLASGLPNKGIFERVNAQGETVWLNAIYNPMKNTEGKVIKVIKFATDITAQKQKELEVQQMLEEARAQEEEIRQNMEEITATQEEMVKVQLEMQAQTDIINSIAIVSKTDLKGNITYVNEEFLKWSKYSKEEVMGKNHRILKSGDQEDQIFVDMWKTISSGKIFRGEIKNKAKDGSFYWVDAIVAPVLDENGKPKEYIAQRFVINDKKEQEEKMAKMLAELQNKKK